ncbi:hypothetical protein OSTOST_13369, partial [Ostertagia ostertagi]
MSTLIENLHNNNVIFSYYGFIDDKVLGEVLQITKSKLEGTAMAQQKPAWDTTRYQKFRSNLMGIGESAIAEIVESWEDALASKNIKLAYLPQPGSVRLRLSSYGDTMEKLRTTIDAEVEKLKPLIGSYIFGYENYGEEPPTLEILISNLLRERKQTLALAESCTGGYISSLFTAIPGASEIFKGAIVPYTNLSKHELLQ